MKSISLNNFYHVCAAQIPLSMVFISQPQKRLAVLWENEHVSDEENYDPWWRHQMETLSALLTLWPGNSAVTVEFPSLRPVTWSFVVFFDLHLNRRLGKQPRRRWFVTPSSSLWRDYNILDLPTPVKQRPPRNTQVA